MVQPSPPTSGPPPGSTGAFAILEASSLKLDDTELQRFSLLWFGFTLLVQLLAMARAWQARDAAATLGILLAASLFNLLLLQDSARANVARAEIVRGLANGLFAFGGILFTGGFPSPIWMSAFPVVINPNTLSMRLSLLLTGFSVACQWAAWLLCDGVPVDYPEAVGRSALLFTTTVFFRFMFDAQASHRKRAAESARDFERERASKQEAEARFRLAEQSATHSRMASLGLLAASVAHEINNPINTIINSSQIILDGDARDAGGQERFHRLIISEGERVARVVGNLLQFARGGGEEYGPTSLRRVIEKTLTLVQYQLDRDGIRVDLDLPRDLPPVRARLEEMQQVFLNLLTNARYALLEKRRRTPDLRPGIHISAQRENTSEGPQVTCRVADNGGGIPAENLHRIFDPFFTTKPREEGTGLGLSVSSRIMREHRGRLEVASTFGRETVFTLTLPAIPGGPLESAGGARWTNTWS